MLVAALLEARLAMLIALVQGALIAFAAAYLPEHAFFTSLQPVDIAGLFLVYGIGAALGALAAHRAERPNQYVLAGALLAAVTFALLFSLWLLERTQEPVDVAWMAIAAGLSGLGAGLLTAGSLAAMGSILGITTRLQLMELAQLNSPLLRRLQDEAPGTFHHSVIVANLAERAADRIGADSLLVRVGCYHHDIGKMIQPGYYVENQLGGDNPHDDMDPEASARLIRQHVTNGLELAHQYKLPARIQAFIPEHHGTRLVPYFYRQATERGIAVNEQAFRYPGPKPQTRETAIVMLADSTEAMVRASPDRTSDRIDSIVEEVIAERLAEGELEECDLTLRDLRTIAASFKQTLSGVYHPRIEYPEPTPQERRLRIGRFRPGRRATPRTTTVEPRGPLAGPAGGIEEGPNP
jgi:putative nucleotidyltransferase with HDIG domain